MNCNRSLFWFFLASIIIYNANSARILCVFSTPSVSHQVVFQPYWKELSLRGHDVVVLTPNPLLDPTLTNLTEINLKSSYDVTENFKNLTSQPIGFFEMLDLFMKMGEDLMEVQVLHPEVQNMLNNNTEHFDLLVIETVFTPTLALKERFDCPLIGFLSYAGDTNKHDAIGNPSHPVYNPDMQLPFTNPLTLMQRVFSVLQSIFTRMLWWYVFNPSGDNVVKKYFGEGKSSLYDLERKMDLLFVNSNPIFHNIRPNVPAVVELSGLHIQKKKPLPKDILQYLDDSKEGVIYFSLGSNVQSSLMDKKIFNETVEALGELPYNILWKFEKDDFPNKPSNIKIQKWLPQQDILGHPNVKLFITQGGVQSLDEAIFNEVPMLGIPFFGDQPWNIAQMVHKGMGLQMNFNNITKNELKNTIFELIKNSKYKAKVKEIHELIIDTPMDPLEKAIWWTEYVLRHGGAQHLRSPSIDIPLYQYLLLDVIGILAIITFIVYKLLYFILLLVIKIIRTINLKFKPVGKKIKQN